MQGLKLSSIGFGSTYSSIYNKEPLEIVLLIFSTPTLHLKTHRSSKTLRKPIAPVYRRITQPLIGLLQVGVYRF